MPAYKNSRRTFLQQISAGLTASTLFPFNALGARQKKPNIIFLLTDDQRWNTMGCMGNPFAQTPNMDRLASEGILFRNAFVTTAICVTSRASIFLGQYARRHEINDFGKPFSQEQLANTYPIQLKKNGYRIGFIGKYGIGAPLPVKEYDYWKGVPGQPRYETKDEDGNPIHCTRLFRNQALEFLQGSSKDRPFCLSLSFKAPHVEDSDPRQFIPDPAYDNLYKDVTIPPPERTSEEYIKSLPDFLASEKMMTHVRWKMRFKTPELYQTMVKNHYRLIYGADKVLGDIREELSRKGLADNTIIVLLGDNGFFLGERKFAGKWYGYEESIRVPLVIYDPRLPKNKRGAVRDEMALNIDIAPTIYEWAGIDTPKDVQGKSLVPLTEGETPKWRTNFLYEHLFEVPEKSQDKVGIIPPSVGVRTKRYKYLRYIKQDPVYEQVFDLKNDPGEENNLAYSDKHTDLLNRLRKQCDRLMKRNQ